MKLCKKAAHEYEGKRCPMCAAEYFKSYRQANKEQEAERMKRYRATNKEKIVEQKKQWREANKDKQAEYRDANKEKIAGQAKQYREANKEKLAEQKKQYMRDRAATDHLFKLSGNIRCLIRSAHKNQGYSKTTKTAEILGCDFEALQTHLIKSALTNYGFYLYDEHYHIDHIVPLASVKDEAELLALNHHSNLQYLYPEHNKSKSDKLDWTLHNTR